MADPDGYDGGNTTGFVSPAGDSLEGPIDLSEVLDLRRPHRYPVRVLGEAMASRGILPGDVLIAELAQRDGGWWMRPGRSDRPAIPIDGDDAEVWAVVAALVRPRV